MLEHYGIVHSGQETEQKKCKFGIRQDREHQEHDPHFLFLTPFRCLFTLGIKRLIHILAQNSHDVRVLAYNLTNKQAYFINFPASYPIQADSSDLPSHIPSPMPSPSIPNGVCKLSLLSGMHSSLHRRLDSLSRHTCNCPTRSSLTLSDPGLCRSLSSHCPPCSLSRTLQLHAYVKAHLYHNTLHVCQPPPRRSHDLAPSKFRILIFTH